MDTYAVYLKPRGSFYGQIRSTTIFGGVCWALQILGLTGPSELFAAGEPPFIFSSAFPYLEANGHKVRFFPRPLIPDLTAGEVEMLAEKRARERGKGLKEAKLEVIEEAKRLKKARYVSEAIFRDIVLGELDTKGLLSRYKRIGTRPSDIELVGDVLITLGEREKLGIEKKLLPFLRQVDVQRNQIDRVKGATVEGLLFYEPQVFLEEMAGLWFITRVKNLSLLPPALRYLEDTGFGGRRSTGKGHFHINLDRENPFQLPDAGDEADCFIVLSLYLPGEGEWGNQGPMSYELINWRGKYESKFPWSGPRPIYKKPVRLMTEGSVFPLKERREFYGRVVDVSHKDTPPALQCGLAIPVFAKVGGGV